ncbi:FHA domain-containing protein [Massilia sp. LXY-6]|uniref:FHA domain-containing protein n=1 Tax=Massilia sp. LXY-6 TaxID=3379823 RepID=UPI003EE01784
MIRCSSPDHPHCTAWIMPGEQACAHGHGQPAADALPSSFGMLQAVRASRDALDAIRPGEQPGPRLHISGFDPRAAGGRQAIKLELRGMPDDCPAELSMLLQSALLPQGGGRQTFTRSLRGGWRPVVVEFSSRGREHGQYRVDVELHARDGQQPGGARTWVATVVLLVPRLDASLAEIHQTYLTARRKVRIQADDASIARLHGLDAAGPLDLAIDARNASIAQVQFGAQPGATEGKIDLALPTIAWDEELIEIDLPATRAAHPCPASSACVVAAEPDAGMQRHLRLLARDEWVLGRIDADADLLLCHYGERGPEHDGLTRRISARHALIRPGRQSFEIEDVSRYGLLLDGTWPGRHNPVPLRLGMRVELTASIKGVAALVVTALLPHAVVLHRVDAGGAAECFMLLAPETAPAHATTAAAAGCALPRAAVLPQLFHRDGGFWHRDPASGAETPLGPAAALNRLAGFHGRVRFTAGAYPETRAARSADRRAGSQVAPH